MIFSIIVVYFRSSEAGPPEKRIKRSSSGSLSYENIEHNQSLYIEGGRIKTDIDDSFCVDIDERVTDVASGITASFIAPRTHHDFRANTTRFSEVSRTGKVQSSVMT